MSSLSPIPGEVDPAIPAARRALTVRLLADAVRHYEEALAFADEVDAARPAYARKDFEPGYVEPTYLEIPEARAWAVLSSEADAAWEAAESTLATLLMNLYDEVAPEGYRVGRVAAGSPFVPRGVATGGKTYSVNVDPAHAERNSVAVVRDDRVIRID